MCQHLLLRYHREVISQSRGNSQTLQGVELYDLFLDCTQIVLKRAKLWNALQI